MMRSDAARIGGPVAELQLHFALEALRHVGQHRGGARVQTGRIRNDDCVGSDRRARALAIESVAAPCES